MIMQNDMFGWLRGMSPAERAEKCYIARGMVRVHFKEMKASRDKLTQHRTAKANEEKAADSKRLKDTAALACPSGRLEDTGGNGEGAKPKVSPCLCLCIHFPLVDVGRSDMQRANYEVC